MATLRIGENDRDADGKIRVGPEPRSLADLMPTVALVQEKAKRPTFNRQELIGGVLAAVIVTLGLLYFGGSRPAPAAPPAPATIPATAPPRGDGITAPSPLPATAPPAPAAAIVAYFDYADPETATAIEARMIERVIGRAGSIWRLVQAGSARVWVDAEQVPAGIPADDPLPDLSPRKPAPAPAAAPVDPPAAPAPTQCAEVGVPGKMTSACGTAALETLQARAQAEWLATYGGNVGQVGRPTPQVREP